MGALLAFLASLQVLAWASVLEHPVTSPELREQDIGASLESELSLAKGKAVYVVCDPGGGAIYIKARGVTLEGLPVADYTLIGQPPTAKPMRVLKKKALAEPERERIKPKSIDESKDGDEAKSTTADTYDVKALEVHDMPASFSIYLDGGVTLHIVPIAETLKGRMGAFVAGVHRGFARPVIRQWHALRGEPHSEMEISLGEADARALYWHLPEGTMVLLRPPGEKASP